MKSSVPIPDNPWPHDMVIRVDENPNNVCLLLFIRSAWGIASDADVPLLDSEPGPGNSILPSSGSAEEWSARWKREWVKAWEWYPLSDLHPRPTSRLLRSLSRPGQLLHPALPPFWQAEWGDDGIDGAAFNRWLAALRPDPLVALEEQPERVCLDALIAAWNAGLETIVTLPYKGYFAERISARHLVVSDATRADRESYNRALVTPLILN